MLEQVTETVQMNKRPLLTPDEVMALPGPKKNSVGDIEESGEMISRVSGAAPIRGRQPLYFLDDVFLARAKVPAPLVSDRFGFEMKEETKAKMVELEKDEEVETEAGGETEDSAKPEAQADHVQYALVERVKSKAEPEKQKDQPESDQKTEAEVLPDRVQASDQAQGVSVERVEGRAEPEQRDQPEPERAVKMEGGYEITR